MDIEESIMTPARLMMAMCIGGTLFWIGLGCLILEICES